MISNPVTTWSHYIQSCLCINRSHVRYSCCIFDDDNTHSWTLWDLQTTVPRDPKMGIFKSIAVPWWPLFFRRNLEHHIHQCIIHIMGRSCDALMAFLMPTARTMGQNLTKNSTQRMPFWLNNRRTFSMLLWQLGATTFSHVNITGMTYC